jgi:putative tryptophan/tyrosine transport system substrate-binding protein
MRRLSRREVVLLGFAMLLLSVPRAEAESGRAFRVGLLVPATVAEGIDVFVDKLRQLGYEVGHNLVLDRRIVETAERNAAIAAELVAVKPDVLLGSGSQQVEALKRATGSIPIVFTWVSDPVGLRIIDSLPRPGGNVTGIANYIPELSAKRLEMISEVVTGATRIAILFNPTNAAGIEVLTETKAAAATRGVLLVPAPTRSLEELPAALQQVVDEKADALIVFSDVLFSTAYASVIEFAVQKRLPIIFSVARQVRAGGLMSYGVDPADGFRRAAVYVDKILKGAKPADLPVENPTRLELVVNLKTAKALGLTIPPAILARADEVIE